MSYTYQKREDLFVSLHSIPSKDPLTSWFIFLKMYLHALMFTFVIHISMDFDKCMESYIPHSSMQNSSITLRIPLCTPFIQPLILPQSPGNHWSFLHPYAFSRMSNKENHTIYSFFSLFLFLNKTCLRFIYDVANVNSSFIFIDQ